MLFIAGKIVFEILSPLSLVILILFASYFVRRRRGRLADRIVFCCAAALTLLSLPLTVRVLGGYIESVYPTRAIADYPVADAIVVLGGSVARLQRPRHEAEEIGPSRLLPAVRLYRAKKSAIVLLSGGVPYLGPKGEVRTEADDMQDVIVDMGLPVKAIVKERRSRNTRENATYTAEVLKPFRAKRILLVTQAFHIRRATVSFLKQGFEVIPVPVANQITQSGLSLLDFLPTSGALSSNTQILKEYLGYLLVCGTM